MGATTSTNYDPTTIATAAENVAMSLTQDCTLTQNDNQTINAIVAGGNITLSCPTIDITNLSNTMSGNGTYKCFQNSVTKEQLMNGVAQALGGASSTAGGAFSSTTTNVGSFTYTNEEINSIFNSYANCLNSISNNQTITSLEAGGNITITCDSTTNGIIDISKIANNQTINVVSGCTQALQNSFNAANSVQQSLAPVTGSSSGLDTAGLVGVIVGCCVGLALLIALVWVLRRHFAKPPPPPPPPQYYRYP
jgi:hypothetical protein